MTRDEIVVIHEVANDIKWLKKATEDNALFNSNDHKQIIEHLTILNGQVNSNKNSIDKNKTHINIQWWIITVVTLAIGAKLIGVY